MFFENLSYYIDRNVLNQTNHVMYNVKNIIMETRITVVNGVFMLFCTIVTYCIFIFRIITIKGINWYISYCGLKKVGI